MNELEQRVYNIFQTLSPKNQRELLRDVCNNIVEGKRYIDAAEFIVAQLGGDAVQVSMDYRSSDGD